MKLLPKTILQKDYFGLSINPNAIRAISINSEKNIKSQAEIAITPEIFNHGVMDQAALINALQQLLNQGGFSSPYAAVSLPEYHSFTRIHHLPKMDLDEVGDALSWQLDDIFPLPKSQIYFDWKLVSQTESGLDVVIVAVEKQTLDDLVTVFESAKIKPISFEPASSALTRVITLDPKQPALLIDINPYGSAVSLIENNLSTLAITSSYQISQDPQVAKQNINITSQAIQSITNFYYQKHSNEKLTKSKLLLTGESASQDLVKWLSTTLNQPVEMVGIDNIQPKFHHAFAAAATTINPPNSGLSINLLPDRLQSIFKAQRNYQQLKTKLQLSIGLLLVSVLISAGGFSLTLMELAQTNQQLIQVESSSSNITYNSDLISSVNKASRSIVNLFPSKVTPVELLELIDQTTPENIVIKNYLYQTSDRKLTLTGVAIDRTTLIQYRQDLLDTGNFSSVNLPFGSLEKPEDIEFTIVLTIKPKDNHE